MLDLSTVSFDAGRTVSRHVPYLDGGRWIVGSLESILFYSFLFFSEDFFDFRKQPSRPSPGHVDDDDLSDLFLDLIHQA